MAEIYLPSNPDCSRSWKQPLSVTTVTAQRVVDTVLSVMEMLIQTGWTRSAALGPAAICNLQMEESDLILLVETAICKRIETVFI